VDLAHKYYASICDNTRTFNSLEELVELLEKYQKEDEYTSSTFAREYLKSNVVEDYKRVLKL